MFASSRPPAPRWLVWRATVWRATPLTPRPSCMCWSQVVVALVLVGPQESVRLIAMQELVVVVAVFVGQQGTACPMPVGAQRTRRVVRVHHRGRYL